MQTPSGLGSVIAILVLVLCVVLAVLGKAPDPLIVYGLLGALALARLT